jgi:hypothetical protein
MAARNSKGRMLAPNWVTTTYRRERFSQRLRVCLSADEADAVRGRCWMRPGVALEELLGWRNCSDGEVSGGKQGEQCAEEGL